MTYQCKLVINLHEVLNLVLLQHNKVVQVCARPSCTVLTVHHIRLPAVALTCHKEQIKHLHLVQTQTKTVMSAPEVNAAKTAFFVFLLHRCCSNEQARSGSCRAKPVVCQQPAAFPSASELALESATNNT